MSQVKSSFSISPGKPLPLGAFRLPEGVNFAIFSKHAKKICLLIFDEPSGPPIESLELRPDINRTGDIWHIMVHDFEPGYRYLYQADGPWDPYGRGHRFSIEHFLLDPYTRAVTGGSQRGARNAAHHHDLLDDRNTFRRRCAVVEGDFDWEGDRPLKTPLKDSIIYEMHVRGFTYHPSSGVDHPGTYRGVIEKIPYLKELGITAVELLPVTEFNENENLNVNPASGERLKNFWGYSPIAFFAPKASYAADAEGEQHVREFKEMVKALHRAGIEVILDIVFNHTGEGGDDGPVVSFRGLDNSIYYILDPLSREYMNFSGCGNTLNCNHPVVRGLIMDCLRYWVTEMHVDGFRFDLASVLGRDPKGEVMENAPMIEQIAEDPVLADTKIIAEAWDAAGLYQVGSFSSHPRWAEWNGRFRDDIRSFMALQRGTVSSLATRVSGSADLYQRDRAPFNSINFVTSHDGFTLYDLVSYEKKRNEMNGENNRDGTNDNRSWNSGVEGESSDPDISRLRVRRIKLFAVILLLSQGTPMLLAGDEFGRTQQGNNNAYCQDNDVGWVDWSMAEKNGGLLRFFRELIRLRKSHAVFRRDDFFPGKKEPFPEIIWQSLEPGRTDWSAENRLLCFLLDGRATGHGDLRDSDFFVMINGGQDGTRVTIPASPSRKEWQVVVNTAAETPEDIHQAGVPTSVAEDEFEIAGMAAVVLMAGGKQMQPGKMA
ncbi:MAG: glycogen debranching protein GlgX [gamma proteobacterium symbiont of Phacoides pectinatus]